MAIIELLRERFREPAECVIEVDGEEIADLYPFLIEVNVECSRERGCNATLRFEARRDEHGEWSVLDDGVFVPWRSITIRAVFGSLEEEIMSGHVVQVDADFPAEAGQASFTVACRDAALKLDRGHVRATWGTEAEPVSDEDIVNEILDRHGLSPHADNAPGQADLVQQNQDSTDIAFLRGRARANGYELLFEGDTVYFGPMRLDAEPQEAILVYAGRDTHSVNMSVRFDGHQPDAVAYEVAEPEGDGVAEAVVRPDLFEMGPTAADSEHAGLDDFVWRLSREGTRNTEELSAVAQRRANEFAMKLKARGELDGSQYGHVLRVGQPVGVDGVGSTLAGVYYVDKVTHRFDTDGYKQAFELLRNAYGDNL